MVTKEKKTDLVSLALKIAFEVPALPEKKLF